MSSYIVHYIHGIGHRVVSNEGKVVGTFDDSDEAEDHRDKLNNGALKEHELWEK